EVVEDAAALLVDETFAAYRNRRHLAGARGQAVAHQFIGGVLASAGDEPALEAILADDERLVGGTRPLAPNAAQPRDDLDGVSLAQQARSMIARRHEFAVDLNGDGAPLHAELFQQGRHGKRRRHGARLAVHREIEHGPLSVVLCPLRGAESLPRSLYNDVN